MCYLLHCFQRDRGSILASDEAQIQKGAGEIEASERTL